ncbi:lytic polysaccharide monooxygenase [Myceligenerans pegani]|uniref:Lytic polysaccharide monooxygenase n=1 Tax=Myceligenerans pegani TaxID=2776917 RepID=A0ABR9N305_9MICO|nr:lytic polysaccharide monooxygenase [Myceligenerans sp. TRM 65318]MBE1878026.1 lytic polysaccharide monooxygenase [Myceligenerans sp. TRM 65318]MBE3020297.1 lytic polysaccharide monooxygenase [Myceligenerans sp. TRM 65318]
MKGTAVPRAVHSPTRLAPGRLALAVLAVLALAITVLVAAPTSLTPSAQAHGWVSDPPSRQDHCASGTVSHDCQGIQYEPQSVEAPKGSMQCSGGSRFTNLDNDSHAWPRTSIGSTHTFTWTITANHRTSTWEYFVDGQLFRTFDDGGAQPPSTVRHTLSGLPSGNHKILARWNVYDTAMAFYACIDVNVGGGGGDPTDPPDPDPGDCSAPAWVSSVAYLGGAEVSYQGSHYRAKWWTQGEIPSQSGQWGVWEDLGPC